MAPEIKFQTLSVTCGDSAKPITTDTSIFYEEANIHVYGNDVYYGDGTAVSNATQGAATPNCSTGLANSVISFLKCRPCDIYVKNYTNAATAYVYMTGTLRG